MPTIKELNDNLDIIAQLADEPNDVEGLSAAELKGKFDKAGKIIRDFVNQSLIPDTAGYIDERAKEMALGQLPDDSVTLEKLAPDTRKKLEDGAQKRYLLSHMLTTPGAHHFTVPANMTDADIVLLGGGASGEYWGNVNAQACGGGSGYLNFLKGRKLHPGEVIPYIVGADAAPSTLSSGYNMPGNLSSFDGFTALGGGASYSSSVTRHIGSHGGSGGGGRTKDESTPGGSCGNNGGCGSTGSTSNRPGGMGSGARAYNPHDPSGSYCGGGASSGGATCFAEALPLGGLGFMGRGGDSGRDATGYGNGGGGHTANPVGKGTQGCILLYTFNDLLIERPLADFYNASLCETQPGCLKSQTGAEFETSGAWSDFAVEPNEGRLSFSGKIRAVTGDYALGLSQNPGGYSPGDLDFGFVTDKAAGLTRLIANGALNGVSFAMVQGDSYKIAYENGRFVWYRNGNAVHTGSAHTLEAPLYGVVGFNASGLECSELKWMGRAV